MYVLHTLNYPRQREKEPRCMSSCLASSFFSVSDSQFVFACRYTPTILCNGIATTRVVLHQSEKVSLHTLYMLGGSRYIPFSVRIVALVMTAQIDVNLHELQYLQVAAPQRA